MIMANPRREILVTLLPSLFLFFIYFGMIWSRGGRGFLTSMEDDVNDWTVAFHR